MTRKFLLAPGLIRRSAFAPAATCAASITEKIY